MAGSSGPVIFICLFCDGNVIAGVLCCSHNQKENKHKEENNMKKMISVVLMLILLLTLSVTAFADCIVNNYDGTYTRYYDDGSALLYNSITGEACLYSSDGSLAYNNGYGGVTYNNGNGYSNYQNGYGFGTEQYADGSYSITQDGTQYNYDPYGNLVNVMAFNGQYYVEIWSRGY